MAQLSFARHDLVLRRGEAPFSTRLAIAVCNRPATADHPALLAGEQLLLTESVHVPAAALPESIGELQRRQQRRHPGLLVCRGILEWDPRDDFRDLPDAIAHTITDGSPQQQQQQRCSRTAQAWRLNAPCRFAATIWDGNETLRPARVADLDAPADWSCLRQAAPWLLDVATALWFLKSEGDPHGSVRLENVVVTAENRAKLAHFDWLRDQQLEARCCDRAATKIDRHAAPELLREMIASGRRASSFAGDVYGLGLLAIELATGEVPFSTLADEDIEALVTSEQDLGLRPDDRAAISDAEWRLISPLLARDPDLRPSIEEVVDILTAIASGDAETFTSGGSSRTNVRGRSPFCLLGRQRGSMLPQRGE